MARTKQPESVKILEYFNTADIAVAREVLALATAAVKGRGPKPTKRENTKLLQQGTASTLVSQLVAKAD